MLAPHGAAQASNHPLDAEGDVPETQGVHETLDPVLDPGQEPDDERWSGVDRFRTAIDIATSHKWEDGSDDVIIATGDRFPDALSGSTLAGMLGAPILLVHNDLLELGHEDVLDEVAGAIDELGADTLHLLGGSEAISNGVRDYLLNNSDATSHERVAGETRYETARDIGTMSDDGARVDGEQVAFVATGENFPDALAAGSGAYDTAAPIFLTQPHELHNAAAEGLEDFDPDLVYVLGGTEAVSTSVENELENNYDVERLRGEGDFTDRFDTAVRVAEEFESEFGFLPTDVGLSNGGVFPDALAAGPFLGENEAPQVLVQTNDVPEPTDRYLEDRACLIQTLHFFGGTVRITEDTVDEAKGLAACPPDGEPGEPETITVTVEPETLTVGETATATALVEDEEGDAVEDAEVEFTTEHSADADVTPETATVETDAEGEAEFDFTTDEPGQVTVTGEVDGLSDSATATFDAEPPDFGVDLSGILEIIPGSVIFDQGDLGADGAIDISVDRDDNMIHWDLEAQNLSSGPTASPLHIHEGSWLQNGPVLVALVQDVEEDLDVEEDPVDGTFSVNGEGSVEAAPEVIDAILDNPTGHYANLHTTDYPAGALRNQLDDSAVDPPEPIDIVDATQTATETATVVGTVEDPRMETVTVTLVDQNDESITVVTPVEDPADTEIDLGVELEEGVEGVWQVDVPLETEEGQELADGEIDVIAHGTVEIPDAEDLVREDTDGFTKGDTVP